MLDTLSVTLKGAERRRLLYHHKGHHILGRTRMLSASARAGDLVNSCTSNRWLSRLYVLRVKQLTARPLLSYACRNLAVKNAISSAAMARPGGGDGFELAPDVVPQRPEQRPLVLVAVAAFLNAIVNNCA